MLYAPTQFIAEHLPDMQEFQDQYESSYIIGNRPVDHRSLGCTSSISAVMLAFNHLITAEFPGYRIGIAYHLSCVARDEEPFYTSQLLLSSHSNNLSPVIIYSVPWYPGEHMDRAQDMLVKLKQVLYTAYPDRVYGNLHRAV